MNIVLWILQVVLAGVFAAHGWLLVSPPPELLPIINEEMGVVFRYVLGTAEIMGAIGILLPAATRIMPWLTEVSAFVAYGRWRVRPIQPKKVSIAFNQAR